MTSFSTGAVPRPVVLLVDDEGALLELLELELSREFDVDTARSADEAQACLATRAYDAVVCDHMMPGEEGLQFLIRARTHFPGTLRIMVTGYMNPDLISRSTSLAGLSACLIKPVPADEISRAPE